MDKFCGSDYWNFEKLWHTSSPDLTYCFQESSLSWVPSIFLLICLPIEIQRIRSKHNFLPWTVLNVTKLVLTLVLVIFSAMELVASLINFYDVFPVAYYTPGIKLITYLAVLMLIYHHKKSGIHTSGVLFLFWFILTISTAINYGSVISKIWFNGAYEQSLNTVTYITKMGTSPIIFIQFLLAFFSDTVSKETDSNQKQPSPKLTASFPSMLTFFWVTPLVVLGYKKPLTLDDTWKAPKKITTGWNSKLFGQNDTNQKERGIMKPLLKTYWVEITGIFFLKLAATLMVFANPNILNWLLSFLTVRNEPVWHGYFYAILLFTAAIVSSVITSQYNYFMTTNGIKMKAVISNTIYAKSLKLSSTGRKMFTIGEMVNLISIDSERIGNIIMVAMELWSLPMQVAIAIVMLWNQLGISTLAGIAVMVLLVPLNSYIGAKLKILFMAIMKIKDKRIKLLNEVLSGIRVLKMYAWEKSFNSKVEEIRAEEIKKLKGTAYVFGLIFFSLNSAQLLMALASFAMFVLIDSNNVLTANVVFVSISLFNIMGMPMTVLPYHITNIVSFWVSMKRVNKYLNGDELDDDQITHDQTDNCQVRVDDASFKWSSDGFSDDRLTLIDVSFKVRPKKLVAVVGPVGCGKSSLLSSLLGDMVKVKGQVNVLGSVAYVPQQAWIQNATVRDNILLLKPYNEKKFNEVIEACQLKPDLEILQGGDLTEIGEKGINLSGGQKQRISMARACYSNADLLLLDDPISALDAHVSKKIFDDVIGPSGMLKNKTRILATHRISVLPFVDEVIVMKDGKIIEQGTFQELIKKKGDFAELVMEYLEKEGDATEDLTAIEELISENKPDLLRQFSRSVSHLSGLSGSEGNVKKRGSTASSTKLPDKDKKEKSGPGKGKLTEVEAEEIGSVKWKVYISYFQKIGFISLALIAVNEFFLGSLVFTNSLWIQNWSDDSLNPDNANNTGLRNTRIIVYGSLGVTQMIFTLFSAVYTSLVCLKGAKIVHDQMLERLMRAPMAHFDTTPMGRILNRFSKDIDVADSAMHWNIRIFVRQSFDGLVSIAMIGYQIPWVLLAVLPVAIVYYFLQRFYIATSRQLRRVQSNSRSPILNHFSETLNGTSSIRAYRLDKEFTEELNKRFDTYQVVVYSAMVANRWLSTYLDLLGYSLMLLSGLMVVVLRNSITPGVAGVVLMFANKITMNLMWFVQAVTGLETDVVSIERCLEYTETPMEKPWVIDTNRPESKWPAKGSIEFQDYSTRYREGLDLVLKKINLEVAPGQRIGVVGRTGAGKSSLTLALFRLIEPVEGTIKIDEIDIAAIGLHDLRSRLTIIPQDPVLFNGTLRMNLDPFEEYNDDQLWKVLELSHLKDFVSTLPDGLGHAITESGGNLSTGQKQLICLARALLRRSRVLVLDEATAAIDVETDKLLQKTIRDEFQEHTIITIAHRLNTIIDYDRILVLDNGQVSEFGSPEQLLQDTKSVFYSMAKDAGVLNKS